MQSLSHNPLTHHAILRTQQRGISQRDLTLALTHGMQVQQNGAAVFFLGRRHLPQGLSPAEADRLEGTTVVVARTGQVITTYRCQRVPRRIRKRTRRCRVAKRYV